MTKTRVLIRADAGPTIGVGHVMRCLTLANELVQQGAQVVLVTAGIPDRLRSTAGAFGVAVADLETTEMNSTVGLLASLKPDCVIIDGYGFAPLLEEVAALAPVVVVDDDGILAAAGSRLVINQNLHAERAMYPRHEDGELLLGARYALLRPGVLSAAQARELRTGTRRVLVSLGGADPLALTASYADELLAAGLDVRVAVGSANPRREDLVALALREPRLEVDPGDLVQSMVWADVAIVGAGTTLWEVGHLGLPSVAVIVAENQIRGGQAAAASGIVDLVDVRTVDPLEAVSRTLRLLEDPEARYRMAELGPALFDGRGASRCAAAVLKLCAG